MIDKYEDRNREQTLDAVKDFSANRLEEFLEYEREHKNRKTVIRPLERQLVTVTAQKQGYVGGQWFDDSGEQRTVRRTKRVEDAIEDGTLQEVE